jgi:hypothetical protein
VVLSLPNPERQRWGQNGPDFENESGPFVLFFEPVPLWLVSFRRDGVRFPLAARFPFRPGLAADRVRRGCEGRPEPRADSLRARRWVTGWTCGSAPRVGQQS